ncbi:MULTISPECIES: CopD family protein [Pseudonocardia]|uniref:Copper transport protein YcnJ n=2 Tax=Pseudonocardia TaxID=1847 RepID=A0A1Y2MRC0_PSEAH|nr:MULTISPECIES: CopD family protein [Pseudonocardia]OSY37766.1 Copper transport protein YcnJ precursor [Pseudonocardia autotrophica]TDN75744.1 putative copper resistance protein D [Pseudonocardia autotrophica]
MTGDTARHDAGPAVVTGWCAIALGAAVVAAGASGGIAADSVPLGLAATVVRGGADLAALLVAGAALAMILAPGRVPGAGRMLIAAVPAWFAVLLVEAVVRSSIMAGESPATVRPADVVGYLTGPAAGTGLIVAGTATLLLLGCAAGLPAGSGHGAGPAVLVLVIAVAGAAAPPAFGHAAASANAVIAVPGVVLHVAAALLWVGGLGAVLVLARDPVLLADALPRFSRLAGWSVGVLAVSGLLAATARLGSPAELVGGAYGALVLVKIVLLAGAAALGGLTRRRLRAGRVPVLAWAGMEIVLLLAAVGVAATLTRTA